MKPLDTDIQLLIQLFQRLGISLQPKADETAKEPLSLDFINNPDGTIRWAWTSSANNANFLQFYAAGSTKAKVYAKILLLLSKLGLSKIFRSGRIELFMTDFDSTLLKNLVGNKFALFTGTVGPNRKALIWHSVVGQPKFLKISLSDKSAEIIKTEKERLTQLDSLHLKTIEYPKVSHYKDHVLEITDISSVSQKRVNNLSVHHIEVLEEIAHKTAGVSKINETTCWKELSKNIATLKATQDPRLPVNLIRKLDLLATQIDTELLCPTSLSHGDFTPWNMFVGDQKLYVYDWELSADQQPMLWDAFHFIFQAGILIHRQPTTTILSQIDDFLNDPRTQKVVQQHNIDSSLSLKLYLLGNLSYYLVVYANQKNWHIQIQWLIKTWNESLSVLLEKEKKYTQRQLFCMDIFDSLQAMPYAALKFLSRTPELIPEHSDIDLCINRNSSKWLKKFIEHHPFTGSVTTSSKSFMRNYLIVLKDSGLLSLDTIWQFKRTTIEMLDSNEMLREVRQNGNGIKIPSAAMDFNYTWLFYLLNNADVPEKYQQHFLNGSHERLDQITEYLKSKFSFKSCPLGPLMNFQPATKKIVMNTISKNPANSGINKWKNKVYYYWDSLTGLVVKKGMIITFSGVDGAGKSTVIENIRSQIEKGMRRKVIVRRHRPSLLPILSAWKYGKEEAEKKSASTLPRQGNNKSSISSLIRFAYYYFDYFFGQFYILFRYVWRGYVVIYDRYYFDFINDSKRSNISLSPRFTTWFYRFLLKPNLNFFLYASPEEILQRKKELDADTIRALTEQYLSLFEGLSNRYHHSEYIPIHNKELSQTLSKIYDLVKTRA